MTGHSRLAEEAGFTLTELLMAMSVGMIVLIAVLGAFDASLSASGRVEDRTEAVQRGRTAMEQITQRLRSQACPKATVPAIEEGTDDAVTLYIDIDDETFAPQKRRLAYTSDDNGSLVESSFTSSGVWPNQTFGATPSPRPIVTNVSRVSGVGVFRYYAFASDGTVSATPLPTPLAAGDLGRVAKIGVAFTSRATRTADGDRGQLAFQNSVYVRTADPFSPQTGPLCG